MLTAAKRVTKPPKRKVEKKPERLGPYHAGLHLTPTEFDRSTFDEDVACRYELIDGILVVTPMPLPQERDPNEELGYLLRAYRNDHPLGKSLDKTLFEHDLHCGDNRRRADRVIWTGLGRRPHPVEDVPSIVIEFVSEGRRNWLRDYKDKREEYLNIGVKEYWIIDRFRKTMTVYAATVKGFKTKIVQEQQTYTTSLLPGFELLVGKLLAIAQEWE